MLQIVATELERIDAKYLAAKKGYRGGPQLRLCKKVASYLYLLKI